MSDASILANRLLSCLGREDYNAIAEHLTRVPLQAERVLIEAEAPIEKLYFPEAGVISVHDVLGDGTRVGIGILGFEGLAGWPVLLGCSRAPHEAMVAIAAGSALCISTEALLETCRHRPELNKLLLLYVQSFVTQMGGTITSNLHDRLERRLARWLLMNHDRLDGDEIVLTHDQLGVMLGCRRATVTEALHVLEGEQLIYSARGRITIRDRCRLVAFAGNAYGMAEAVYGRLIGPLEKITN